MVVRLPAGLSVRQAVPYTRLGEKQSRPRGIALELVAQLTHVHSEVVTLLRVVGAPDLLQQLPVSDYAAGVSDQRGQQLVFGWRKVGHFTGAKDLPPHQI